MTEAQAAELIHLLKGATMQLAVIAGALVVLVVRGWRR